MYRILFRFYSLFANKIASQHGIEWFGSVIQMDFDGSNNNSNSSNGSTRGNDRDNLLLAQRAPLLYFFLHQNEIQMNGVEKEIVITQSDMIFIVVKVFHDIFMILSFHFLLVLTQQHKRLRCTDGLLSADLKCKINSIFLPEKSVLRRTWKHSPLTRFGWNQTSLILPNDCSISQTGQAIYDRRVPMRVVKTVDSEKNVYVINR